MKPYASVLTLVLSETFLVDSAEITILTIMIRLVLFLGVCEHVSSQGILISSAVVALRTSKRFFPTVDAQVSSQTTLLLKSLAADFALERFFIGVGSHM